MTIVTRREEELGSDQRKGGRPFLQRSRVLAPYLAAAAVLLLAILSLGREIGHHIQALESWIAALGLWGGLAMLGLFVVGTSLLVPESFLGVATGALFGLRWGAPVSLAGNLLAAALQYALSRRLLRRRIDRVLARQPQLAAIQRAVIQDELRLQVLLRLAPLNPAMVSYLLGAAGVSFPGFLMACLAATPHLLLEVYFGHVGKHVVRMAGGGRAAEVTDVLVFGGLALGIVAVVMVSRSAYRAVLEAVARTEAAGDSTGGSAGE